MHVILHFQPQGVTGVGETTGSVSQATGETDEERNVQVGIQDTFVNNFKIIGHALASNFLVHENIHITILADGTVTASVDNFSVTCH